MALRLPWGLDRLIYRTSALPYSNFFVPLSGKDSTYSKLSDKDAIREGYLTNLNWYAITKKAAEGVAMIPYKVEVKTGGKWEEVNPEQNEVANFFFNPNEDQTIGELLEAAMVFYYNTGEAFFINEMESIGFNGQKVVTVPPELICIYLESDSILSNISKYELREPNGLTKDFTPLEVCHLRMFNPEVEAFKKRNGMSPLQAAYNKLRASNNQALGQSSYFENRGTSTIISPQGGANGLAMTKTDKEDIDRATRARMGGSQNVNGVITTMTPVQATQLGTSASDMQMLEQGSAMLRELCNAIFMPSEMFNDPDNKTHANRREAIKTMYNDVFIPGANRFIRSYERTIIKPYGLRSDGKEYRISIDKEKIDALNPDPFEAKRLALQEVDSGTITRNEYREMFGRDKSEAEGMDEPSVRQANYSVNPEVKENT